MPEAVKRPEVIRETGGLFNPRYLLIDVDALAPAASRKDKGAAGAEMRFQEIPGRWVQRYLLIPAALGLPDVNKAPVKIYVSPLQPEKLSPPHAGKQRHPHEIRSHQVRIPVHGLQECGQLLRGQVFRLLIVNPGKFDFKG